MVCCLNERQPVAMNKNIQFFWVFLLYLFFHPLACAQGGEEPGTFASEEPPDILNASRKFYFIPGAGYYGKYAPNVYTITMCSYLESLLGEDFCIIEEPVSQSTVTNVVWALIYGQHPMRHPEKNRKVKLAFDRILADSLDHAGQITIIASSFGTILASQLAISLAGGNNPLLHHPELNLVMGSSLLCKDSELFHELKALQHDGFIQYFVYDELQDAGDNTAGMCGKSRMEAFFNAIRITFVLDKGYRGQPSILNNHPNKGHIHLQRAQSIKKGKDYVKVILVDYALAGPRIRERTREALNRGQ